ncbi:MAG: hypothetical protein U0T73_13905, partial [Chitinophagales bacterium]
MKHKVLLVLSLFILCFSFRSSASHFMGADLTYECLGPNQYLITLAAYRDCKGVPMDNSLTIKISSVQCGVSNMTLVLNQVGPPTDVTPLCPSVQSACSGNGPYGIQKYIFQGVLNLPAGCGSDWNLSWSSCCRNAAITTINNPDNDNLFVQASINNTLTQCNNSPSFTNDPIPFFCNNQLASFNHGVGDVDGDSLVFRLLPSLDAASTPVSYVSGISATNPLFTSGGFSVNPNNGDLSFTPNTTQIGVIKIGVDEYRNGVLIGHIERDMQVIVTNCTNTLPTVSGVNGTSNYTYNVPACSNFCFTMNSSDADAPQVVTMSSADYTNIPGATFTVSSGNRPTGTFCWAPTQQDVGTYFFTVKVRDNACQINGSSVKSYTINVTGSSDPPVNAGRDTTLCPGQSVTLQATSAGSPTSYNWSDGTNTHTGATWNVSPSVTTIYSVTANYASGCALTDQVVVSRANNPVINVYPSTVKICSPSAPAQLGVSTTASPAFYNWAPSGTLSCSNCANPIATTPVAQTYTVTVTNGSGCTASGTANVVINNPPPTQSCTVIYATPNGTGDGSQTNPYNLANALLAAQCNNALIKLGIGTYTIDNPILNIGSNTTLEGGFDPANNWRKTSAAGATTIYRSSLNLDGNSNTKRLVLAYLANVQYVRFQDITFQTANCPAISGTDSFGYSNYVFHINNCSNYNFVRCQIIAGNASNGLDGISPSGSGGASVGGNGGAGGAGAGTGCNTTSSSGGTGSVGSGGATGGSGGAVVNGNGCTFGCGANAKNGNAGSAGANGVAGTDASAIAPASPGTATQYFIAASQSANGTNGQSGGGGGGGSGGTMGTDCFCSISGIPNGGAGGKGGNGGLKGTGGFGGGGTFGVYLFSNGTSAQFIDCSIVTGTAGAGGSGGTGQAGTTGASGNAGVASTGSCSPKSTGGSGGSGGAGGRGGNGQPGANGASGYIVSNGTNPVFIKGASLITINTGINTPSAFALASQPVIFTSNTSCTFRNDTLSSASSAGWDGGASAVPSSGVGSQFITQYGTTGRKDILFGANTYTGFVNITLDQSSFVPNIQSNANVLNGDTFWLCQGSTANFNCVIASADTFDWNFGGATTPNTYLGKNLQNLTGLLFNTAGTFKIKVRIKTDCCGWSPYDSVYLVVDPPASIAYTGTTTFCAGDSAHIILSGSGASYSWAPPTGVSNPSGSNVYLYPQATTTYLVTSYSPRALCNADTSIIITKGIPPSLAFSFNPATCNSNGSATVTANPAGSYTYHWNTGGATATINSQPSGTYYVTVTPSGGNCSATIAGSISAGGGVQAFIDSSVDVKCFGQSNGFIRVKGINGAGGYTYTWSTGTLSASLPNRPAGTYTVTVKDAGNCTATTTGYISQPTQLFLNVLDSLNTRCSNVCSGMLYGDGQGGVGPYTFAWGIAGHLDSARMTHLCPGTYTGTVTDRNLCTANRTITIKSPPALIADTVKTIPNSCFGSNDGQIILSVTGGSRPYSYSWPTIAGESDSIAGPGIAAGTYTAIVIDDSLCRDTVIAAIRQPARLIPTITSTNISCNGGSDGTITVTGVTGGNGGYQYQIDGGGFGSSGAFNGLTSGNHNVEIKDAKGCDTIAVINLT